MHRDRKMPRPHPQSNSRMSMSSLSKLVVSPEIPSKSRVRVNQPYHQKYTLNLSKMSAPRISPRSRKRGMYDDGSCDSDRTKP